MSHTNDPTFGFITRNYTDRTDATDWTRHYVTCANRQDVSAYLSAQGQPRSFQYLGAEINVEDGYPADSLIVRPKGTAIEVYVPVEKAVPGYLLRKV